MTDIYEIAEYTLKALKNCGADAAQCIVDRSKKDELNVDGGKFSLMRSTFNTSISMKAIKGGKKGVTSINQATKEAIDEAAAQCIAAAESSVPDEAEQIAPFTAKAEYKTGVFEPDLDKLFDRIEEFMSQTKKEYPKVILEQLISDYEHSEKLYMNTNGTSLRYEHGEYSFNTMFSAHEGEKASSFNGYFCALDNLDKPFMDAGMQRQLLEESEKQLDTVSPSEKFVGKVIYSPDCFNELLQTALENFASSGVLMDGVLLFAQNTLLVRTEYSEDDQWMYANMNFGGYKTGFRLVLPDAPDLELAIDVQGANEAKDVLNVRFEVGKDCEKVRVAMMPGKASNDDLQKILDGSVTYQDITKTQDVAFDYPADGVYTFYAIPYLNGVNRRVTYLTKELNYQNLGWRKLGFATYTEAFLADMEGQCVFPEQCKEHLWTL